MSFSSEEHRTWARSHWSRIDRDGDGRLTQPELDSTLFRRALREAVGGAEGQRTSAYSRSCMNIERAIDFIRRKADNNGDGQLSFDEFVSFTATLRARTRTVVDTQWGGPNLWAELVFAMFDLDGDNFLQRAEFKELHRFFHGSTVTEDSFEKDWASLDSQGLVNVSKSQFINWMCQGERGRVLDDRPLLQTRMQTQSCPDLSDPKRPTTGPAAYGRMEKVHDRGTGGFKAKGNRPPWNRQHHVVQKNSMKPRAARVYFSRPQSEQELFRFYISQAQFKTHLIRLESMPAVKRPRMILSHETAPPFIPGRHLESGLESKSGRLIPKWTDLWQPAASEFSQQSYRPGTRGLRVGKLDPIPRFDPEND